MRTYIFTRAEEEALLSWLEGGEETPLVTMTLSRVRNADRLALHVEIMARALRKLGQSGRLVGRMRLSTGLASRLRSAG